MKDESTRKTCKKCKWFRPLKDSDIGRCFGILRMGHDGLEPTKTLASDKCDCWTRIEGGNK